MDKIGTGNIDMGALLAQLRNTAAAAQANTVTGSAAAADVASQTGAINFKTQPPTDFSALLKESIGAVNSNQQAATSLSKAFDMGDKSVSLEQVMIAGQKASISFQAMLQVRNKMLTAYQEIMSMQV